MQANIAGKVSFHTDKQYSIAHNTRAYDADKWNKDGHIDAARTPQNVVFCNTPLKQLFEETFGESLDSYNAANEKKHPDRVTSVDKYYNEQKSKVQEAIFQMSDHENYLKLVEQVGQQRADEMHIAYLTDVYNQWQAENPSLKIFCATIHMDEIEDGAPHLHLDFIPVAESSRGLTVKVSMDGAMKKLGFVREPKQKYDEKPYTQWLNHQRSRAEQLASEYITVIPSEPSVIGHKQPQQGKAEKARRNAVAKLTAAFKGKQTIAAAQDIVDNKELVEQVARQNAKDITNKAKVEQLKASRAIKAAERDTAAAKTKTEQAERLQAVAVKNNRIVNSKRAKLAVTVEQEVQKRTAPDNFWARQRQEDERYRNKQFAKAEQLQQEYEKVTHKTVKHTQKGR